MNIREEIKEIINGWGLPIISENEESLVLRYSMSVLTLCNFKDEQAGFTISCATEIGETGKDDESRDILTDICNERTASLFGIKAFVDCDGDLIVNMEYFFLDPERLEEALDFGCGGVTAIMSRIMNKYRKTTSSYREDLVKALLHKLEEP